MQSYIAVYDTFKTFLNQILSLSFPGLPLLTLGRVLAVVIGAPVLAKALGLIFGAPLGAPGPAIMPDDPDRSDRYAIVRREYRDRGHQL